MTIWAARVRKRHSNRQGYATHPRQASVVHYSQPMNLSFLDASTLHRDDLDSAPFEQHGTLRFFETTSPAQIQEHARDAEVVVTNKVPLDETTLAALPELKLILVAATGFNHIDLEAAKSRGIPVCKGERGQSRMALH